MKSLKSRPVTESQDEPFDKATREKNKALTKDFTKLFMELKAEGVFDPSYTHITYRIVELILITVLGLYVVTQYPSLLAKSVGVFALAMGQGRALWVMHEAGHYSLTGNVSIDKKIEAFVIGIWIGWSGIYWRKHHSLHHAMTNRINRDSDLNSKPVFINNMKVLNDPVVRNGPSKAQGLGRIFSPRTSLRGCILYWVLAMAIFPLDTCCVLFCQFKYVPYSSPGYGSTNSLGRTRTFAYL
ncbi:unnamed protein product [Orchesella dallaii]